MADTLDRSVLENKAVSELREIARSLQLKVTGMKKAEMIDAIAGQGNGDRRPASPPGADLPVAAPA
ncbi:MAG TPA: Rho termination factor N-terminal domain-containing protein, partial [Actinomycetota bacterium]|nr:Rho termination factor N-terminal domain-containing protein [Actinomycetota bacterium]